MMRTTVNVPNDVYEAAKSVALVKGISLGDAIADLVRLGLKAEVRVNENKPFPCFNIGSEVPPITLEQTLVAEDDL